MREHFALRADPFSVPHDPRFLLATKPLQLALTRIRGMLEAGAKLVLVAGEIGAGKTALVDALQRDLKDGVRTARILNPGEGWAEIGQEIGSQLRLNGGRLAPAAMVVELGGERTYRVIIDRAEELSPETLRHLSAYLDLAAPPDRSVHKLQLVLIARTIVAAPIYGWAKSRNQAPLKLERLEEADAQRYIQRRLKMAGDEAGRIFDAGALREVSSAAMGNPGTVNRICRGALEIAAACGRSPVDVATVTEAQAAVAAEGIPVRASASAAPAAPGPSDNPLMSSSASPSGQPATDLLMGDAIDADQGASIVSHVSSQKRGSSLGRSFALAMMLLLLLGAGAGVWFYGLPLLEDPAPDPASIARVEIPRPLPVVKPPPPPPPMPEPEVEELIEIVEVEVVVEPEPEPEPVVVPRPAPVVVARKPAPKPTVENLRPRRAQPLPQKPKAMIVAEPEPVPARVAPEVVEEVSDRVELERRDLGPLPPAAEVLADAFDKLRVGDHLRRIDILSHDDVGEHHLRTFEMVRMEDRDRVLTMGVLEGNGSSEMRLLSVETGKVEDERFSYKPSSGKLQKLGTKRARNPFEGTELSYDDFRAREVNQFLIYQIARSHVEGNTLYVVATKPRYRAPYDRVEFVISADDHTLLETHFFGGLGLRPYRILQFPRSSMEVFGRGELPRRMIAYDLATGSVTEARIIDLAKAKGLNRDLFTLATFQDTQLRFPSF